MPTYTHDDECVLRAARLVGNRRAWIDGRISDDDFYKLVRQEVIETNGGVAQLAIALTWLAHLAIEFAASGRGLTFDDTLAMIRATFTEGA